MAKTRYPGMRANFASSEINRLNEAADRSLLRTNLTANSLPAISESSIVLAKNSSGSDRNQYDCMSISGMLWDYLADGTTDLVFDLDTADPDGAPAILLEPIANNAFGLVMIDGPCIAKVEASSDAGYRFAKPKASTHSLEPAAVGPIKLLAAPSTSAVKYIPAILNVGTGASLEVRVSGRSLQYSNDGGENWVTFGMMQLRHNSGQYQYTLNAHLETPDWYDWLPTTVCPTP